MNNLYSVDYEKAIIAAILQDPNCLLDLGFLKSSDFCNQNSTIFELCRNIFENKGLISVLTVTEKAKSYSLKIEGMEIIDYITSLYNLPINIKEIPQIAKEVKKLSLIRHVIKKADELKEIVSNSTTKPVKEIFSAIDDTLSKSLETFETSIDDPVNVYDIIENIVEERGNNPIEIVGHVTPYKTFNDYYGGIRNGNIYCVASRQGSGKSTFLQHMLDGIVNECNKNIKALYLDTEMQIEDHVIRLAAMKTGCPYYLIDTGLWRKDIVWFPTMREKLKELKSNKENNLYFKQVGSMGIKDLCTFIKRWYYGKVGKGNQCVISYDYLKLLLADKSNSNEWQGILDKIQYLKDVIDEINSPLLTAIQVNRTGVVTNRQSSEVVDDESVISTSDRVGWLVSYLAILRRKTPDEIVRDGENAGSHKLVTLKSRFQGKISTGHTDLVKLFIDKKIQYRMNYINLNINNFNMEDRGSLRELADRNGWTRLIQKENKNEDIAI